MNTTKPTSFRLSEQTKRQLEDLAAQYRTKTVALTVAVDRLYRDHERSTDDLCVDPLDNPQIDDIEAAVGLDGYWQRSPWWEFAHHGTYVDRQATQAEYSTEMYWALRKRWPEARILLHEQDTLPGSEHALLVNGSADHDLAYYVESEIDQVFARLGDLTVLRHYSIEPCDLAALAALRDQVAEVTERYGAEAEAALLRIDRQPEPIEILCLLPDGRAGVFDAGTEVWLDATSAEDAARHYLGAGIGG